MSLDSINKCWITQLEPRTYVRKKGMSIAGTIFILWGKIHWMYETAKERGKYWNALFNQSMNWRPCLRFCRCHLPCIDWFKRSATLLRKRNPQKQLIIFNLLHGKFVVTDIRRKVLMYLYYNKKCGRRFINVWAFSLSSKHFVSKPSFQPNIQTGL